MILLLQARLSKVSVTSIHEIASIEDRSKDGPICRHTIAVRSKHHFCIDLVQTVHSSWQCTVHENGTGEGKKKSEARVYPIYRAQDKLACLHQRFHPLEVITADPELGATK